VEIIDYFVILADHGLLGPAALSGKRAGASMIINNNAIYTL